MDYTVYIPTKGRQGLPLLTMGYLMEFSDVHPIIVCPSEEADNLRCQYNTYSVQAVNMKYLGEVWQRILENCPTNGVIIIDDDLKFDVRQKGWSNDLEPIKDLNPMFEWMSDQLDAGYAHGAISSRKINCLRNSIESDLHDCANAKDCLFFNRDVLLQEGARLDRLKTMQDFDITLQLLSMGYPNRVGYNWSVDQKDPAAAGGTTLYRTPDVQKEAAYRLASLWPDFVKVIQKEAASKEAIYGGTRYDVRIAWRKCWKHRDKNHKQMIQVPEPVL